MKQLIQNFLLPQNRMGAVMLTVQKANVSAMNFYTNKLRYFMADSDGYVVSVLL